MENNKDLYLVWQGAEDEQYYNQYFSLKDAVTSEPEGSRIMKASLTYIGQYEIVTKLVKKPAKKTVKKAAKGKK